jgi:hypothetical protein
MIGKTPGGSTSGGGLGGKIGLLALSRSISVQSPFYSHRILSALDAKSCCRRFWTARVRKYEARDLRGNEGVILGAPAHAG